MRFLLAAALVCAVSLTSLAPVGGAEGGAPHLVFSFAPDRAAGAGMSSRLSSTFNLHPAYVTGLETLSATAEPVPEGLRLTLHGPAGATTFLQPIVGRVGNESLVAPEAVRDAVELEWTDVGAFSRVTVLSTPRVSDRDPTFGELAGPLNIPTPADLQEQRSSGDFRVPILDGYLGEHPLSIDCINCTRVTWHDGAAPGGVSVLTSVLTRNHSLVAFWSAPWLDLGATRLLPLDIAAQRLNESLHRSGRDVRDVAFTDRTYVSVGMPVVNNFYRVTLSSGEVLFVTQDALTGNVLTTSITRGAYVQEDGAGREKPGAAPTGDAARVRSVPGASPLAAAGIAAIAMVLVRSRLSRA